MLPDQCDHSLSHSATPQYHPHRPGSFPGGDGGFELEMLMQYLNSTFSLFCQVGLSLAVAHRFHNLLQSKSSVANTDDDDTLS